MRAHRSRETGARRSCTRSALDQSPRPHPGLSDRRLCCTLDRRDHVQPPGGEEQSPTVGRVRLVHNNRPTEVDHSSHGVPMQIASIMLRGPAEAGRQRPVGVDVPRNVHSTNPWRFTDRPKPERRRLPTSIDPIARLSSIDTTTTTRDQVPVRRPSPILDRVAEGGNRLRETRCRAHAPLTVWPPVPTAPKRRRTTWVTRSPHPVDAQSFQTSSGGHPDGHRTFLTNPIARVYLPCIRCT